MDYCHPCRRHLNGALACPGCGAPVETRQASGSVETPYEGVESTGAGQHGHPAVGRPTAGHPAAGPSADEPDADHGDGEGDGDGVDGPGAFRPG
ncbi:hypothetical protein ACFWIJ_28750, partial [Streptomyces sp. NPDC127079]